MATDTTTKAKDPRRQQIGRESRKKGDQFESKLDRTFDYYDEQGYASITKTPEPMKPLRSLGKGQFVACFTKKAQPDYKGTQKGGRAVLIEAKYTDSDRMEQSRVKPDQSEYLDKHMVLGARCFVVIGFSSGNVYKIPWEVWRDMKYIYGRKYVTEADVQNYLVGVAWNNTLLLL